MANLQVDLAQVLPVDLANHNNPHSQLEAVCSVRLNQVNQLQVVVYSAKLITNNKVVLDSVVDLVVAVSASKTSQQHQASVVALDLRTQPALVLVLALVLDSVVDSGKTNQALVRRVQLARPVVVSSVANKTSNNRQLLADLAQAVVASALDRTTNSNNNNNLNNNPVVSALVVA